MIDLEDVSPYSPLREEVGMQHINYWLVKAFDEIDAAFWRYQAMSDEEREASP